jgi:hypothetical protein
MFSDVPSNASVLGWFSPLTKTTLADVLQDLGTHFGPPEINRHFVEGRMCTQMPSQKRIVKIAAWAAG